MTTQIFPFSPPERPFQPPFVQWTGENRLLSWPECKALIEIGNETELGFGNIGNGDNYGFKLDPEYRCVRTRGLFPTDDRLGWLFERLRDRVTWANEAHYRFDLTSIIEGVQFLRYDEPEGETPGGHYRWHQDFGGGRSSLRKLSVVVQLSPAEDYEGGELHLFTDQDFVPQFQEQGEAILFPSWTPHMVSPVTKGTRYALAVWVSGPQFR